MTTTGSGPANLRDVGGLRLTVGGHVRAGVLYRSDAWYAVDEIVDRRPHWPPTDVVDLRSAAELDRAAPPAWSAHTQVHHTPLLAEAAPAVLDRPLSDLYEHMLTVSGALVADAARVVAAAEGPTLVHCSAGKDRTGVAVGIILLAVGVEPDDVVLDYRATEANLPAVMARVVHMGYPAPVFDDLPRYVREAPADAIAVVTGLHATWPGGAAGWLRDHGLGDADLARLVAKLAPVPDRLCESRR